MVLAGCFLSCIMRERHYGTVFIRKETYTTKMITIQWNKLNGIVIVQIIIGDEHKKSMVRSLTRKKCIKSMLMVIVPLSTMVLVQITSLLVYDKTSVLEQPTVCLWRQNASIAYAFGWDDNNRRGHIARHFMEEISMHDTQFLNVQESFLNRSDGVLFLDALFRGHDLQAHGYTHYPTNSPPTDPQRWLQNTTRCFEETFGYVPQVLAYPNYVHVNDSYTNGYFIYGRDGDTTSTGAIKQLPTPDGECGLFFQLFDCNCRNGDFYRSFYNVYSNYGGSDHAAYYYDHYTAIGLENLTCYKQQVDRFNDEDDVWYTTWGEMMAYRLEYDNVTITDYGYDSVNEVVSFKANLTGAQLRWPNKTVNIPLTYRVDIPDDWTSPVFLNNGKISSSINSTKEPGYVYVDGIPDGRTLKICRNSPFKDTIPPVIENMVLEYVSLGGLTHLRINLNVEDNQSEITDVNITIYSPTGNANFSRLGPGTDSGYGYKYYWWDYEWYGNETYLFFDNVQNPIFWNNNTYGRFVPNVNSANEINKTYAYTIEVADASGNRNTYIKNLEKIIILSPENKIYYENSVPLAFTIDKPMSWIGYSLDGAANITITGNTTLTSLAYGEHNLIVYANDTLGNERSSDRVYFTVSPLVHDVAVINVIPAANVTCEGYSLEIRVKVKNEGTITETFNVTTYANATSIQTLTVTDLAPGNEKTLTFFWNTTNVASDNYTIHAKATRVPGETDMIDNTFTDGIVCVNPPPDIAVTNVAPSKTVVKVGCSLSVNVTVGNQGYCTVTFNLTAYVNTRIIDTFTTITLTSGSSTTVTFTLDTTGVAKGNYTITAYAPPVPDEADLVDNTHTDGWVIVTVPGDVDGDFDVDIYDIVKICAKYGSRPPYRPYKPNCDINCDGIINIYDLVIACANYGQKDQ